MTYIKVVLLILGVFLLGYASGTPGDQWVASFFGGTSLGVYVGLSEIS